MDLELPVAGCPKVETTATEEFWEVMRASHEAQTCLYVLMVSASVSAYSFLSVLSP